MTVWIDIAITLLLCCGRLATGTMNKCKSEATVEEGKALSKQGTAFKLYMKKGHGIGVGHTKIE